MCIVSPPTVTPQQIPDRQAAKAPDNGDATVRASDQAKRRLALAASIFTPQNGSLGAPVVTGAAQTTLGS